jgi:hypothetical protein
MNEVRGDLTFEEMVQGLVNGLRPTFLAVQGWLQQPEVARCMTVRRDPALPERLKGAIQFVEEMPKRLQKSLRESGRMLHPNISLADVAEVVRTYERDGTHVARALVDKLNEQVVNDRNFRTDLALRWSGSKRWPILEQILKVHDLGLFFVSVPAAISMAEGLVVDCVSHNGYLAQSKLIEHIRGLVAPDEFFGPAAERFLASVVLAKFEHGMPIPPFSRHAILHGGDIAYGTKEHSVLAIVWLDYLMQTHTETLATPRSPDPPSSSTRRPDGVNGHG